MKKFLIFSFLIFSSLVMFSQVTFEKTYTNGSLDLGASVLEVEDGYVMCGATFDDANLDFDIFATKVDLDGVVVWTKIYTSTGIGHGYANYMCETADGDFLLTGTSYDPAVGDQDVFVLKIDGDGNELWVEEFDGGGAENDGANYITEDADGIITVCGYASFEVAKAIVKKMWIFGLQPDGTKIAERFYSLNGDDEANSFIDLADGSMAIIGTSYDNINGDYDGVLIKANAMGEEVWKVFSIGTANEEYNDFVIDINGNFIITGLIEDEINKDDDLLLMSVSADGNILNYSYTFDYSAGDDVANRIYIKDGEYFLAGYIGDTQFNDVDAYLARINPATGTILGSVVYGDIYDDEFYDFDFTADGGYICIGYQNTSTSTSDIYLVKTDDNGEVTSIKDAIKIEETKIYPNPTSNIINISNDIFENYSITSIEGKIVDNGSIENKIVNVNTLPAGIYFITLKNERQTSTFKFVKN